MNDGNVANPLCLQHLALDEKVEELDGRVTCLETKSEDQDKRLTRVEVLLEAQAKNVKDMAEIQRDNMMWARGEISEHRKSSVASQKNMVNIMAHLTEIIIILALGGKLAGVF